MELLIALMAFILVSTITPGPNNLLLAASGMRFGIQATLPHLLGIHCGIYFMTALGAMGLHALILEIPETLFAIKVFGSGYLVYLAWKIMGFELQTGEVSGEHKPMTTLQAAIFQFSNPKAWIMITTGLNIAYQLRDSGWEAALMVCLGFATIGATCNLLWILAGQSLHGLWQEPKYRVGINSGLALITFVTVILFWM